MQPPVGKDSPIFEISRKEILSESIGSKGTIYWLMSDRIYQCWPSLFDGRQSHLIVTEDFVHVHLKVSLDFQLDRWRELTDDDIQKKFVKGLKTMSRRNLRRIEWNPEQLRLSLVGTEGKIHVPFRKGLDELGDAYFRELVNGLRELGVIVEEEQALMDRHASALLNLMGFSLAAGILWWMQATDDPLDYEGRRKRTFEIAKGYLALTGIWGVVGVAAAGVWIAMRKYLSRERNPVPMFVAERA